MESGKRVMVILIMYKNDKKKTVGEKNKFRKCTFARPANFMQTKTWKGF